MIAAYLPHNRSVQGYGMPRRQLESRLTSDGAKFEWFIDSVHGLLEERPAFGRLRQCLTVGAVDALSIRSADRLTRDLAELASRISLCRSTSTRLIMVDSLMPS